MKKVKFGNFEIDSTGQICYNVGKITIEHNEMEDFIKAIVKYYEEKKRRMKKRV